METEINKLQSLLKEKNFAEATKVIDQIVKAEMTEEEKGGMLVDMASTYMDVVNAVNEEYRDSLKEVIEGLERIKQSESRVSDKVKLAEVKQSLNIGTK